MRLGTRVRYGTRAMLDLAMHYEQGPVVMRDVARRQEVSESYLENLMVPLRSAGLVRTVRGSRGGYALTRSPSQVTLGEILRTLEGSLACVPCLDDPALCHRVAACAARRIWSRLQQTVDETTDRITLADMVQIQKEIDSAPSTAKSGQSAECEFYI